MFANTDSGALESPNTASNLNFNWSLHLQGWENTSQNIAVFQAATILVPATSDKIYFATKIPTKVAMQLETNRLKKNRREKCEKCINPWTNYQLIYC